MPKPALIIHAGAGNYPKDLKRAKLYQEKLSEICAEGFKFLKNHSAPDSVVEIVRQLEDWPETNAGMGSVTQSDGTARLSASLMDGDRMIFSGVINIEKIKNPILVAKLLQKEKDRILAGDGALRFAKKHGFKPVKIKTRKILPKKKYSTVGACALDRNGNLAAATSTGGKGMELVGRVSDSALPAGNYANSYAALSATGIGEDIVEASLCPAIAFRALDLKNLKQALDRTFRESKKRRFAVIALDKNGNMLTEKTTEILYWASQAGKSVKLFSL